MPRPRRMLVVTSLLVALLASILPHGRGGARVAPAVSEPQSRPNFLVIITDDQRTDTLEVMRRTRRWFRQGGTEFVDAHITTPLCCPARASYFTGQHAHSHGVLTNVDAPRLDQRATVQRYLQEHGYRTAIVGKYLNRWGIRKRPPYFDRWAVHVAGYEDRRFNINGSVSKRRGYTTDIVANHAVRQVRRLAATGRPWLLFVTPFAAHGPFTPAPRHRGAEVPGWVPNPAVLDPDRIGKPDEVLSQPAPRLAKARRVRRLQLRTLMAVDQLVGRVMSELARQGQTEDTLAVFTSDNGFLWGEFGLFDKRRPYTAAHRVPLLLRWPGRIPAGAVDGRPVTNVDLAPTMLELAGIEPDPEYPLDGRSLLGPSTRSRIFLEYFHHPTRESRMEWASIRGGGIQYTEYYREVPGEHGPQEEIAFREYYDLDDDPWMLVNLLEDGDPTTGPSPGELLVLHEGLAADRTCTGTTGPGACP